MVHDDDTGDPPHIGLTGGDYPSDGIRSVRLPSRRIQQRIIELAQQSGYGAHTICRQLEEEGHSVTVSAVRAVLAGANLDRR
jgi:hypothetical protein